MNLPVSIGKRGSRWAAFAILIGLIILFCTTIIAPLVSAQLELNDEIETARKQLGRLEIIIERNKDRQAQRAIPIKDDIWGAESPAVISAKVQEQVQSVSAQNNISLISISQTQTRYSDKFLTSGLVIEGHGEMAEFVDLFTALEASRPLLFLDKLKVRQYQPPSGLKSGERLPIAVRFELHAPYRTEAKAR
ncbi:type II secretion system protein GspM [Labrenzia sp. PHM005]|uniref:type II secretion system protein GspM n=1 Tax=Labrenzia sp. PHM005 TaxID=2590016 RepID=UPI00143CED51|nr:type II secretion system protein GspM [Labrenzia sp. PHM005]